jgi:peptide/nickel transport system substrate-binding protein
VGLDRHWSVGPSALAPSPAIAATHTVTINAVQIFGTIDPAKISDYMASANFYDGLANVD